MICPKKLTKLSFDSIFLNRYQSETKENVLVTSQSSTYIEFRLKRQDFVNENEHSNVSSKVQLFYHKAKDFVLHRTLFLLISGIFG